MPFKSLCVLEFYGKTKKRYAIIRNNRNYLENNFEPNDELLASVLSLNCITEEQCLVIQRQRSTREKNCKLMDVLKSFDETKLSTFVNCLRHTNQRTVAKIIENGGGLTFKFYLTLPFWFLIFIHLVWPKRCLCKNSALFIVSPQSLSSGTV